MLELEPITGWVVRTRHAARVVAPPYDALTPDQRAAQAAADPDSYLGALPPGADGHEPTTESRLRRCRDHLDRLLAGDRFRPLPAPALVVLAIGRGAARTIAIVGDVPVTAFTDGRVRPHEDTRPDRVTQLVRYLEVVGVASSPVAVTQRPHPAVTAATAEIVTTPPDVAFTDHAAPAGPPPDVDGPPSDGVDVAAWVVTDTDVAGTLRAAVAAAGTAYVADGHHRAAGVAGYATSRSLAPDHPAARVLTAVIPTDHLQVTPFHRVVDLAPHPQLLAELRAGSWERLRTAGAEVHPLDGTDDPLAVASAGTWHLVVDGRWVVVDGGAWRRAAGRDDPVAALDVDLLGRRLLPALGLSADEARPVAPTLGMAPLVADDGLGIALRPPSWEEVLTVADDGRYLPSKTTYLTPKLRSGLLVVPRSVPPTA